MFPQWSDWNIQYTRKGLLKQQLRLITKLLTFGLLIIILRSLSKESAAWDPRSHGRKYASNVLRNLWKTVNNGIHEIDNSGITHNNQSFSI